METVERIFVSERKVSFALHESITLFDKKT